MIGSRSNLVRLVELVERYAHKDVYLEMTVKKGNISIGLFKSVRGDRRYITPIHSSSSVISNVDDLALEVLESIAEEAVKQGITYKSTERS